MIPELVDDRPLYIDIERVGGMIRSGDLIARVEEAVGPLV